MFYLRSQYLSLPTKPGVYIFLDENEIVIYVGKAINLKSRVSTYFTDTNLGEKTRLLVSKIAKIRIIQVESELESLLLEAYYIKIYNPRFNIRLTDGKFYLSVRITINDKYPKVLLARRSDAKDLYFGPFPNSSALKLVLKTIRKAFPYQSVMNHPKRVCLYNHLGLCPCPPVNDSIIFRKEYRKNISSIIKIFEGKTKVLVKELVKKRNILSADENFEAAAILQNKINALNYITQPTHSPFEYVSNPNLLTDIRHNELTQLENILKDNGCSVASLKRIETYDISNTQGTNATGSMIVFLNGEKAGNLYRKFRINQKSTPDDFSMMKEMLNRRLKHKEWPLPDLIIVDGGKGQVSAAVSVLLSNNLNIPLIGLAKREETIVIPHRQREKVNQTRDSDNEQNASRLTHGVFNLQFREVLLPKESKAILLMQRLRNEAHRFAISYHRLLRSKRALERG